MIEEYHKIFIPSIFRLSCGKWKAVYGESPSCIMGIGRTPKSAIEAYDIAFNILKGEWEIK